MKDATTTRAKPPAAPPTFSIPTARVRSTTPHPKAASSRVKCSALAAEVGGGPSRIRVALQTLQVGAHFRRTLVAQVTIFLEGFVDDLFQLWRDRQDSVVRRDRATSRMALKITAELPAERGGRRSPSRRARRRMRTDRCGRRVLCPLPVLATYTRWCRALPGLVRCSSSVTGSSSRRGSWLDAPGRPWPVRNPESWRVLAL